ncbi:MAG: DinB family protein [Bryobacteraceae bacterium]|jgi:uncharacterized damage-inducible protein DinB
MNERERRLAADHLAASQDRLLGLVDGLTAEQWTFQPGEGRWSIGECLEHVMRVENRILGLIGKKLEGPAEPRTQDSAQEKDAVIAKMVPDRTSRREAPEPVRPIGQFVDTSELLAEFQKTRARTAQFVADTEADLRSYFVPHPAFGDLDCYQWLLVLGLHGERHARQIEEIKADSAYPRCT